MSSVTVYMYVIIVLVVLLVLCDETVACVRILYVVTTTTHTNLHLSSIAWALDVWIQFCSNYTLRRHLNLRAV